jgi:transposase-like protein
MKKSICCINPACPEFNKIDGDRSWLRSHGWYRRKCDSKLVERFRCRTCRKTFSNQTFNPTYRQHRPRINLLVEKLLCTKNSFRDIAREHGINRKTVHQKFLFLAEQARLRQAKRMAVLKDINFVQIDEMETFEHSKCKPLSIALAVVPGSRIVLGAFASEMPAKGPLAEISRKKYGHRRDDRKEAFQNLLKSASPSLSPDVWLASDKKTTYPNWIREVLPQSTHFKAKGKRGCIVGYGEMKKTGFDPLFWINHAAATVRDKLARGLRRTWCTTKLKIYLQQALDLFVDFINKRMERLDRKILDREEWLANCRLYGVIL